MTAVRKKKPEAEVEAPMFKESPKKPSLMLCGPPVKWVGGKTQLLPELLPLVLPKLTATSTYYEPFSGGAALFWAIRKHGFSGPAALNDLNCELLDLWHALRDDYFDFMKLYESVLASFRALPEEEREEWYYALREGRNEEEPRIMRATRFLLLNRLCHGGVFRVNADGGFNVPYGHYPKPAFPLPELLKACSAALQHTGLTCQDYSQLLQQPKKGDFVFLDPPYDPLPGKDSFVAYTKEGFTQSDQIKLADQSRLLAQAGVNVLATNADTEFIREVWTKRNFIVETVDVRRSISRNVEERSATEVIIRSWQ